MKTTFLSVLYVALAGVSRLSAQADAESAAPNSTPVPAAPAPASASAVSPTACPECGSTDCQDEVKGGKDAKPPADDQATLAKLEEDWCEAVAKHDVKFLERIESNDYTSTGPDGTVLHKEDDLQAAKAQIAKIDSYILSDIKVRLYGETAVVTGEALYKGMAGTVDIGGNFRWTDVFVKHDGKWQAVASQGTRIGKPTGG